MSQLFRSLISGDSDRFQKILEAHVGPTQQGRYRHWDTFRHIQLDDGLSTEERWVATKMARRNLYQMLPVTDKSGVAFKYALPGTALQMLHQIDRDASGNIQASDQVTNPHTRETYLLKSLLEEAITSSQLEGASTTRQVAKSMIQEGREPRNRSERMIYNNYQAMLFVRRILEQPLTPDLILELQAILTDGTLDTPDAAGRFRRRDEPIEVTDEIGTVLHIPPDADELESRMKALCDFANDINSSEFTHPVVRAIILHFWLAYDHPFVDGNGRTARALFYWSMARQGYWLCEYISISRILKKARGQYARAFLYTETDENDATYFLLYQLRVIIQAIQELHHYLARKAAEIHRTEDLLRQSVALRETLNHRQLALMNHALRNPHARYTVESHRRSHNISYETARSDLLSLSTQRLLDLRKRGRAFEFTPAGDLQTRLTAWSQRHPLSSIAPPRLMEGG